MSYVNEETTKILTGPSIPDLSESSHRVRRNLIFFSALALFYRFHFSDVKILEIFGVKFESAIEIDFVTPLFLIALYHLVHFWMISKEHKKFLSVIKRLTKERIRKNYQNGFDEYVAPKYIEIRLSAIKRFCFIEIGLPICLGIFALLAIFPWVKIVNFLHLIKSVH